MKGCPLGKLKSARGAAITFVTAHAPAHTWLVFCVGFNSLCLSSETDPPYFKELGGDTFSEAYKKALSRGGQPIGSRHIIPAIAQCNLAVFSAAQPIGKILTRGSPEVQAKHIGGGFFVPNPGSSVRPPTCAACVLSRDNHGGDALDRRLLECTWRTLP